MRNQELGQSFQGLPCHVCGDDYGTVGHHIISYGSRPDLDIEENIIPLCQVHHREVHDSPEGLVGFVDTYDLEDEFFMRGFEKIDIPGGTYKWILNI